MVVTAEDMGATAVTARDTADTAVMAEDMAAMAKAFTSKNTICIDRKTCCFPRITVYKNFIINVMSYMTCEIYMFEMCHLLIFIRDM